MHYLGIADIPFVQNSLYISFIWSIVAVIFLTIIHLFYFYILIPNNKFSIYWENISWRKIFRFFYTSFIEEVWFRGVFLLLLFNIIEYPAILISAIFFTIMHHSREAQIFAFLMGILFGFIVIYTNNIIGPFLGHWIFNIINYNFIGPVKIKK